MENQIKKFTIGFFKNLQCVVSDKSDMLVVENVPKSFEDLYGKVAPYHLNFSDQISGTEFVGKGSALLVAMTKFLKEVGKTTLLKIDFDVNPTEEIKKVVHFKNCEIGNLIKKHKNNFFSRFTFISIFHYLNKSEQVVSEIYIHENKVVDGDLSGYKIVEGNNDEASGDYVEKDYEIARDTLKETLKKKTTEISKILKIKVEKEIERIEEHYGHLLDELGGDLSGTIKKVRKTELALRTAEDTEAEILRAKLDKLKKNLVKIGNNDSRDRILAEQEFTIKDAMHKHSLNIDNKLVNTTVIYYPVFNFNLFLNGDNSKRYIEMNYDPLTKTLNKLFCESCGKNINKLNLCSSGHISCDNCLKKCGECGKLFCQKCLKKSCLSCGKLLCKNCAIMCLGCGKYVCQNHMRKDCVSGEDRCSNCLRACLRCHGLSHPKYFGEAMDGSKVCQKCLGAEKRGAVLERVFEN